MYAVISTGGKQYKVSEGQKIKIEKLAGEVGDKIEFDKVLMLGGGEKAKIGTPLLKNKKVKAEITAQDKHKKIIIQKFKKRKKYRRKYGHRQPYTELTITSIPGKGN